MMVPWCRLIASRWSVRAARCAMVSSPRYRTLVSFELMKRASSTVAVVTSGEFVSMWMARLMASNSTACCALFKFAIPSGTIRKEPLRYMIEAINIAKFKVDPAVDNYDSFLPDDATPCISLLGVVVGSLIHMGDDGKGVDVKVSSFVHNKNVDSTFR